MRMVIGAPFSVSPSMHLTPCAFASRRIKGDATRTHGSYFRSYLTGGVSKRIVSVIISTSRSVEETWNMRKLVGKFVFESQRVQVLSTSRKMSLGTKISRFVSKSQRIKYTEQNLRASIIHRNNLHWVIISLPRKTNFRFPRMFTYGKYFKLQTTMKLYPNERTLNCFPVTVIREFR